MARDLNGARSLESAYLLAGKLTDNTTPVNVAGLVMLARMLAETGRQR